MVQQRICCSFNARCKHASIEPTNFLNLPENIRDSIYRGAGVNADSSIRLIGSHSSLELKDRISFVYGDAILFGVHDLHHPPYYCLNVEDGFSDAPTCLNFKLASRAVSVDVARFLFANNNILLCGNDTETFGLFLTLPPRLIRALRCLTIHFGPLRCGSAQDARCCNCSHRNIHNWSKRDHNLDSISSKFQAMLPSWRKMIERLAKLSVLSKLKLNLLSDTADARTAQAILEPVERLRIKACSIRLADAKDSELAAIGDRTVLRMTQPGIQRFRFLDLPTEIRQHVLSFTDLVEPLHQVSQSGSRFHSMSRRMLRDGKYYGCGEFCSRRYAVRPYCDCWTPPTSIMLACKQMLHDARVVFFSQNWFFVGDGYSFPFRAFDFLTNKVPSEALCHLRRLDITFDGALYDFYGIEEEIKVYERALADVLPHLKRLRLRVHIGWALHWTMFSDGGSTIRGESHRTWRSQGRPELGDLASAQDELFRWFSLYEALLRPFTKLESVQDFYLKVTSPFDVRSGSPFQDHLTCFEKRIERQVVGDQYDSTVRGKERLKVVHLGYPVPEYRKDEWPMMASHVYGDLDGSYSFL